MRSFSEIKSDIHRDVGFYHLTKTWLSRTGHLPLSTKVDPTTFLNQENYLIGIFKLFLHNSTIKEPKFVFIVLLLLKIFYLYNCFDFPFYNTFGIWYRDLDHSGLFRVAIFDSFQVIIKKSIVQTIKLKIIKRCSF